MESSESVGSSPTGSENKSLNLHSILIHHGDDDDFFHRPMRPRANTDPVSPRPRLHVTFDLPDIVVDDCSDNDEDNVDRSHPEEINKELRNTAEGAFFVFQSPPRQRANTCPMNMFSRRKPRRNRPPTPPPSETVSQELNRHPSWEKVTFSPHSLSSVEETREMTRDSSNSSCAKSTSETAQRQSRKTNINRSGKTKQKALDSPSSSPKRTLPRIPNGHVTHKSGSHRDHMIHSTA